MDNVQIVNAYMYPNPIYFTAWDDLHGFFDVICRAELWANRHKPERPNAVSRLFYRAAKHPYPVPNAP